MGGEKQYGKNATRRHHTSCWSIFVFWCCIQHGQRDGLWMVQRTGIRPIETGFGAAVDNDCLGHIKTWRIRWRTVCFPIWFISTRNDFVIITFIALFPTNFNSAAMKCLSCNNASWRCTNSSRTTHTGQKSMQTKRSPNYTTNCYRIAIMQSKTLQMKNLIHCGKWNKTCDITISSMNIDRFIKYFLLKWNEKKHHENS